jgi:hypothetical protein
MRRGRNTTPVAIQLLLYYCYDFYHHHQQQQQQQQYLSPQACAVVETLIPVAI